MNDRQKKLPFKERGRKLKRLRGDRTKQEMADFFNISLRTYYRYEDGERKVPDAYLKLAQIDNLSKISEEQPAYKRGGGWRPRPVEEFAGAPANLDFAKAVSMLADIFSSEDDQLIQTMRSTLENFCEQAKLKKKLEDLDKRVRNVEKSSEGSAERRSGKDRRKNDLKAAYEKRSGTDRRLVNGG